DTLHVLVNDAGGFFTRREETADGLELTFALNHLSYFLVTNLLMDAIKSSAPARIINLTSGIHARERQMPFDDLQTMEFYKGFKAYGRSKLANLLFTYELARRLEDTGVTVNAYNPGFTATGLGMQPGGFGPLMRWMVSKMAKNPQKAAEPLIWLASSDEVEGVSGNYFEHKEPVRSSAASHDTSAARILWEISEKMTGHKTGV
ncbi:SDR family NAD(P)-dependent oxidoreductase, partial [candidate division WOR-3 bacterium]|nr:SDR family NAD(P)-dependent oxidoreductase [candidate division WOR-3 bacterium]MBD3364909.1 SDR family NAD(P)-dependent oxidoreductase [candidate division WOR-3 bacterium]